MKDDAKTTAQTHPSVYIRQELRARRWSLDDLATRMGGDFGINRVALDFYMTIGPDNRHLRIGSSAEGLARAFDVSPDLLHNLERAWLGEPKREFSVVGSRP